MPAQLEELTQHIERQIGAIHKVFHEVVSDDLHIDVHHVKSTVFRRFEVLVTSGMSAKAMSMPADSTESHFLEVLVLLPKGWPLRQAAFSDEANYWPIRLLKQIARYPHHAGTWLGFGHTIINERRAAYAENTSLCAAALLPPTSLRQDAWRLRTAGGDEVSFLAVVPLYPAELDYKLEHGIDALLDLFDKNNVSDRIDPARPSVVAARSNA